MTSIKNPVQVAGLKQAAYIMECLVRNHSEEQIVRTLGGDKQLFDIWKSFLLHNQWMEETMQGWSVTAKGSIWNKQIASRAV